MSKTVDQSKTISADKNGNAITNTLASYILANSVCADCGNPMRMQKGRDGSFYMACAGYPNCKTTSKIEVDLINRYLYRHGGAGQRCPQCNFSMEAKKGTYNHPYVQCCGIGRHRYKLDEI